MMHWCSVPLIFQEDRITVQILPLPVEKSEIWIQKWYVNFSMPFLIQAGMIIHFKQLSGVNNHHIAECAFKAFAKALDMATGYDERITGVLSTKGSL